MKIVAGGGTDDSVGWFVEPTLLQVDDPMYRTMCEEIFGPVLTVHVYPGRQVVGDPGAGGPDRSVRAHRRVFARDRAAVAEADRALRYAAGNYYVNDKPTGAVVGQQPFGGGRASGTNDKAGLGAEPAALGVAAGDQGDLRAAEGLSVSVHGRGVRAVASRALAEDPDTDMLLAALG